MKIFTRASLALLMFFGIYSQQAKSQTTESTETTVTTQRERDPFLSPGGFFLEPFLDYETADTKIISSQILPGVTSDTSGTNQGFGIGTRLGGHVWESFWLAADVRYSRTALADSFYGSADADNFSYGPTLGVQTPWVGIRVYGTYILGGFSDPSEGNMGMNLRFKDLRGYRIGAGVHLAAVSVNLEYHDQKFKTTELQSIGSVALRAPTSIDTTGTGYTLSVGFPLEL